MFKKLMNKKLLKNQKGLTLIELLAVIVILAIVAAIAVPAIGNIIQNSKYNAIKADAINVLNAANLYYTDTTSSSAKDPVTTQDLIDEGFLKSVGKLPLDAKVSKTKLQLNTTVTGVLNYTINFENATLETINKDTKKGSDITSSYVVGSNK